MIVDTSRWATILELAEDPTGVDELSRAASRPGHELICRFVVHLGTKLLLGRSHRSKESELPIGPIRSFLVGFYLKPRSLQRGSIVRSDRTSE